MDSNTYSDRPPTGRPAGSPDEQPDGLAALTDALDELDGQDLGRLPDAIRAARVPALRRLADRLEGQWLKELAGVDAHGPPAPTRTSQPVPPPAGCAPACG